MPRDLTLSVERDGFAIVEAVAGPGEVAELRVALDAVPPSQAVRERAEVYAIRNLLTGVAAVARMAEADPLRALAARVIGPGAFPVRAILFDKPPSANWLVPWHQDLSIAVRERVETAGFGPWSLKAGVVHVRPPVSILEGMVALRLHLDACGGNSGALQVIPGSHRAGRLARTAIACLVRKRAVVTCLAGPGAVVLMRPLLMHSSGRAQEPGRRRVIHIEYAAAPLPGALRWA